MSGTVYGCGYAESQIMKRRCSHCGAYAKTCVACTTEQCTCGGQNKRWIPVPATPKKQRASGGV